MNLLLAGLIAAQPIIIDSDRVEFDGQTIRLSENVSIKDEAYHFTADHIDWNESADRLKLKGRVRCTMSDGTFLSCESADCDLAKLILMLEGNVAISEGRLMLQADKMELQLSQAKQIHSVKLDNNIKFHFQNELNITAKKAVYERGGEHSGMVRLSDSCECSNPFGDRLFAEEISLDVANQRTLFISPRGVLSNGEISAERLLWSHNENTITLQQNVKASLDEIGSFNVKDEATLFYNVVDGVRELKKMESIGESLVTIRDSKKTCTIFCYGAMVLDKELQLITMTSPVNAAGFTERGSQVFFQDGLAKMAADKVLLNFVEQKVLDKVVLEGHVQLINRLAQFSGAEPPLQYALADEIEYLPNTKELSLISHGRQRVLFQDSINHIQISAPALKIKRSTPVQRGYIQGVGDVRFSFAKSEVDLLKEAFWHGGA